MMKSLRLDTGSAIAALAAVLTAAVLGYLNLHNDEVQMPLMLLLLSAFLLGCIHPRRAWAWALIVGLGVPLSSLLALKTGVFYPCLPGHPYSCDPMTASTALSTFVLIVPAMISAYLGVLLRQSEWWREVA